MKKIIYISAVLTVLVFHGSSAVQSASKQVKATTGHATKDVPLTLRKLNETKKADVIAYKKSTLDALKRNPELSVSTLKDKQGRSQAQWIAAMKDRDVFILEGPGREPFGFMVLGHSSPSSTHHIKMLTRISAKDDRGYAMLFDQLDESARGENIEIIRWNIAADNHKYCQLAKRNGFIQSAAIPNAIKRVDGYADYIIFLKQIDKK